MRTDPRKMCQVLITIITSMLLFGCSKTTPSPNQVDKSPFTGIPCAAPCWHGLLIGKSNENEVASTLQTLTFIDQNSVYYHKMTSMSTLNPGVFGEGVEIRADCVSSKKQCLSIQVVENILTQISIKLNYQFNVEEALRNLGNPDYIGFDRAGGEQTACRVFLIWSKKRLLLASETFKGLSAAEKNCFQIRETGKISPSLLISEVRYTSTAAIEEMLSNSRSEFFRFSGVWSK